MDGSNWNFEIELVEARIGNWDFSRARIERGKEGKMVSIESLPSVYRVSIHINASNYCGKG